MWNGMHDEPGDVLEVVGIDGVQRQIVGDSDSCDQRVVRSHCRLTTGGPETCRHPSEYSSGRCIKRKRIEVALGLLYTSVTDLAGTITTTVDLLGRSVAYTDVWAKTSGSTYDQTTGRLSSTSGPVGAQTFTYDRAGRTLSQTLDGVTIATPAYETPATVNEFSVASVAYSNATSVVFGRNTAGAVTSSTWKQGHDDACG